MRNSLPSLPRQFYGPGQRGSISAKKATESEIHVLATANNLTDYGLGFIKLGDPEFIDQIRYCDDDSFEIILSSENRDKVESAVDDLRKIIQKYNGKFTFVRMSEEEYNGKSLIGVFDSKYYVAHLDRDSAKKNIERLVELFNKSIGLKKYSEEIIKSQVRSHQKVTLDLDNDSRVIAKMGFNLLSSVRGIDYILDSKFDQTRDYIIGKSNEQRNPRIVPNAFGEEFKSLLPVDSHFLILCNYEGKTYCTASFYGSQITYAIDLFPFEEDVDLIGFVIDWKNQKDFYLIDYLKSLH